MSKLLFSKLSLCLLLIATVAACKTAGGGSSAGTRILQPGAPGQDTKTISTAQATDLSKVGATAADIKFMQGMIGHHAQAVEMVDLLMQNSNSNAMKNLALRIKVSQDDEMNMMRKYLADHGAAVPGPHSHHEPGGFMPGMLTPEEMTQLGNAKGVEFDRLFLMGMIKHHGGAITMVEELFKTPGAAQEGGIFAFASDVDADQRMEIDRMGAMLREIMK
ncbi:MAG TPA: DUF305 domain-containing protein [Vicinamibacterales bacterium]|nr:DUF305 domain-containing protein [Vicinamibacterales bacterium]HTH26763.1 DUF305 domain-containing protein [Vicinamibacterales bacterium]